MIQLRHNGKVVAVGNPEAIMDEFERRVKTWIAETIGLDENGDLWSVKELPDIVEYGGDHGVAAPM